MKAEDKKVRKYKWLRIIGKSMLFLILFFVLLILFIRSPWGQNIIVDKTVDYLKGKTGTEIFIDRLFITFSGNLQLEGLYVEDLMHDTLLYSEKLEINVELLPLIKGEKLHLKSLNWDGLIANVLREDSSEAFNFDFIIDAFASPSENSADQPAPSNQSNMQIELGEIDFNRFNVKYDDGNLGLKTHMILGNLHLEVEELDLEKMNFQIADLEMSDTDIDYYQLKPLPQMTDTLKDDSTLPTLAIENFNLANVNLNYRSIPDNITATSKISQLSLDVPKFNLTTQEIVVNTFSFKNSILKLDIINPNKKKLVVENPDSIFLFTWPEWFVKINEIDIEKIQFAFNQDNNIRLTSFDPNHIEVTDFNFKAKDIFLEGSAPDITSSSSSSATSEHQIGLIVNEISFSEKSGFNLQKTGLQVTANDTQAAVSNLAFKTTNSSLGGNLVLNYTSIDELINYPLHPNFQVSMPTIVVGWKDLIIFQPDLMKDPYISSLSQNNIIGHLNVNGTMDELNLDSLKLSWGTNTEVALSGIINNVMNPKEINIVSSNFNFKTQRSVVTKFVSEKDLGVQIPERVSLKGTFKGRPEDLVVNADMKTSDGNIKVVGKYSNINKIKYDGKIWVKELQLDKLLNNDQLGSISLDLQSNGQGNDLNDLDAQLTTNFSHLTYNNYDFSSLKLDGQIKNGIANLHSDFKDENLDLQINSTAQLDSINSIIQAEINLEGADLKALGVTEENILAKFHLTADFNGNLNQFKLNTNVNEGLAVYNKRSYPVGELNLIAQVSKDTTQLKLTHKILDVNLLSNADPEHIFTTLNKEITNYFSNSTTFDTISDNHFLKLQVSIHEDPILNDVFLQGLERMDSVSINVDFKEDDHLLIAKIIAPYIKYNQSILEDFNVDVNADPANFDFDINWDQLNSDPIVMGKTNLKGRIEEKKLFLDFISYDEDKTMVHLQPELIINDDTLFVHINPNDLILNEKQWQIPNENKILLTDKYVQIEDFVLTRNEQELSISTVLPNRKKEHVALNFNNFKLSTFIGLINSEEELANGLLKGKLIIEEPFGEAGLVADLNISDFYIKSVDMGELSVDANSSDGSNYNFDLRLKEGNADIDLTGGFLAKVDGAEIDLNLALNAINLKILEAFLSEEISNAEGMVQGNFSVNGNVKDPQYQGEINFENASLLVNALNVKFSLKDENIQVNNEGVFLKNFTIADEQKNTFQLDGNIKTKSLTNPTFDLKLTAENFSAINAKKVDNSLFYGKVNINAGLNIKGNAHIPIVTGNIGLNKGTDFTLVVPESELDVLERDGVVMFVNRSEDNKILTKVQEDVSETAILSGYNLNVELNVNKDSKFTIVLDERTGDNFSVSGAGDFNLGLDPNGRANLSGRYEVDGGHFETNLYNLVKKRFEITPGSTITWSGDPLDASLDVRATYNVETSASALMASTTTTQSVESTNKYRQKLPFIVYLNLNGQLLTPEITFNLDMPEAQQGFLGGEVYSRVQQLNKQEEELNKQVFALLVWDGFFPESGSDGSSGGPVSIARNNVNNVLSGQLNNYAAKLLGKTGVDLNFGLDSYTDYQGDSPTDRTQLDINASKSLLNDRLVVQVGSEVDVDGGTASNQTSPVIGNVSIEYLLTENGRYRLKGYRRNEFESVIDGQLVVTGIALIFNREFNSLKNILAKSADKEVSKQESEKIDDQK